MHAPNAPEVEGRVSNVIALFELNAGAANAYAQEKQTMPEKSLTK
jgi:hypothetical protein